MSFKDMIKKSVWESFAAGNTVTGSFLLQAAAAMAAAVVLGIVIYAIYSHFYGGVVYSHSFATTLVGMTVLTCMITLAISSNLVISLGMVGALSIVRYRTAIKDPMDLMYLFWSISMGIVCGAKLYVLAVLTMVVMIFVVFFFYSRKRQGCIYILVAHYTSDMAGDQILRALSKMRHQLKSKTVRGNRTELTLEVLCKNRNTAFLESIRAIDGVTDVTLIQYNGEYHG